MTPDIKYFNIDFTSKLENLNSLKMIAILQFLLSVISFSLSSILVKSLKNRVTEYNDISFVFLRFLFIGLISYLICIKQGISRTKIQKEDLKWVIIRIVSTFFGFLFLILSIAILRLGTAVCILMMSNIWVSFLAIILLKEKFYFRYISGGIICFIGAVLMLMNERSHKQVEKNFPLAIVLLGMIYAFGNSIVTALINIAQKTLSNKYESVYLNYLVGLYASLIALLFGLFTSNFVSDLINPIIIFYAFINSVVSCCAFHYRNVSYKHIEMNNVTLMGYLELVLSTIAGYFIFDEMIFLMDFFGASMIIGYNLYNVWIVSKENK